MVEKLQEQMYLNGANIACRGNVPYGLFGLSRVTDRLHIGNRWMAQSGFNTYDNTARMHYPLLPSFDVPDPLSQDYPHLSPYSHCAGNPLSIIDPTGEWIVGTDNKKIHYLSKTGFSKNTTSDIKIIGSAMMKTNIGKGVFEKMIKSKYPIKLYFGTTETDNAGKTETKTQTTTYNFKNSKKQITRFQSVEIIINKDVVENGMTDDSIYKGKGLTFEDKLGAVGTHEGTHATVKNANSVILGNTTEAKDKAEVEARKVEQKYIDEILQIRKKNEEE